jgi:hypothetical protein
MARDMIAELLYHFFAEDKKENPMPEKAKIRLLNKIAAILQRQTERK